MRFRDYDPGVDQKAVHRIWLETGWLEKDKTQVVDILVECGRAMVAEVNEEERVAILGEGLPIGLKLAG